MNFFWESIKRDSEHPNRIYTSKKWFGNKTKEFLEQKDVLLKYSSIHCKIIQIKLFLTTSWDI